MSVVVAHRQREVYGPDMVTTIGEILPEAARRFGDKTSVLVDGEAFSFARARHDVERRRQRAGLDGGTAR